MGVTTPMYKIFEISMMFLGIYNFFNLVFFFLFDNIGRGRFRFFLGRKDTLVIRSQQRLIEDGMNPVPCRR